MATDKTTKTEKEKELTVEERLKALYDLQTILSEIDRIKSIRGELPNEVRDIEDKIAGLQTRMSGFKDDVTNLNNGINDEHRAIEEASALIDKYTVQQDNVRNNREFDFLSKEIEYQGLIIQAADKKIGEYSRKIEEKHADIEVTENNLADLEHILGEKKEELGEIVSETKQEEDKLRDEAKKLEVKIEPRLLTAFKRIRGNARNGLGIVHISRNACGGCFASIPPQRQMEIRLHKKVIVCEYCGRILIDPELVGIAPEVTATIKK